MPNVDVRVRILAVLLAASFASVPAVAEEKENRLLWGDTHLHSSNSFDAFLNRNMTADPATAYRYAKGLPVIHPLHRARIQIETPLDFLVVADHAEYLGVMRHIRERGIPSEELGFVDRLTAAYLEYWLDGVIEDDAGMEVFSSFLPTPSSVEDAAAAGRESAIPGSDSMERTTWQEAVRTADAFNAPGEFTALIGWEWSSIPAGANLHRVVFTSAGADTASKFQPWSSVQSMYPEDLWSWLDRTASETGAEFVAIPHNSNISKGYMFQDQTLRGVAYTSEVAKMRARWEPVVEATQIKGDSETHPDLSPDDPFADFETYPHYIQNDAPPYVAAEGDYVRSGLRLGLSIEQRLGINPYRFGLIGSTDSHTGISSAEEPNFWGKFARDSIPENKAASWRTGGGPDGWAMSASGLAGVWSEANTRSAILEAFRRREVYATTGPRIVVRLLAGWDYEAADAESPEVGPIAGRGVPMGGELNARDGEGAAPRIWVQVLKDPKGANLDRVQVVKGWIDAAGETHERVFDAAWSGDRAPGADGTVGPVGTTVDPDTATYTNEIGAARFATVWQDPSFDPTEPCFYYVRVLEIPTPRHSLFDAVALGVDPSETQRPRSIQERAYTSPVWYQP